MDVSFGMVPRSATRQFRELSRNAYGLFTILCAYRNDRTGECFPTMAEQMRESGLNRTAWYEAWSNLEEKGWAKRPARDGGQIVLLKGFEAENGGQKSESGDTGLQQLADNPVSGDTGQKIRESRTESSGNPGLHIGITNHEQTMNKPKRDGARARDDFSPAEIALLGILGWGLAPGQVQADRVRLAAEQLDELAAHYGSPYEPLPERVARFPDYIKAHGYKRWGPDMIATHWKRAIDWMNSNGDPNGTSTNRRKTRAEIDEEILRARDYKSFNDS